MGTIRQESSHSLSDQPEGFSLVPDYGYYDWLFDRTLQPSLPPFDFLLLPVTAVTSGCPFDFFFRSNLRERSFSIVT
ncbi:MAG: hypothetical protein WC384_18875 [Prolixibacteraceae bacterium]|jgi:hypothetical protein